MTPRLVLVLLAVALAGGSLALLRARGHVADETRMLDSARVAVAAAAGDARLGASVDRIRLALEGARGRPARDAEAHLALAISDGLLTLERGDIVLRSTEVTADVPRGIHTIESVEDQVITLAGGVTLRAARSTDSLPAPAGVIRVDRLEFNAIRPNLKPGQSAYFF